MARLSEMGGSKYPDKSLTPTVPFTLLPQSFFDPKRWRLVERGRWRYGDHITLGESRTVLKLLERWLATLSAMIMQFLLCRTTGLQLAV